MEGPRVITKKCYSSLSNGANSKEKVIAEIESLKNNLDISKIDYKEFQEFANGFYQGEGTNGAYFSSIDSLKVKFNFSIGQNYSKQAAILFLRLQAFLGGIGRIKIDYTTSSKIHIRYVIYNTQEIFEKAVPYFNLVYGHKRYVLANLMKIYNLSINIKDNSNKEDYLKLVSELIHLVYSTNLQGNPRKICLQEKLSFFKIPPPEKKLLQI